MTEKSSKCNARVQVRDGMLRKYLCVKNLYLFVKDIHRKNLQADFCAKECQLNRKKSREVKGNSKLPRKSTVTSGDVTQDKGNIVEPTLHGEVSLKLKKACLISIDTVVTHTMSSPRYARWFILSLLLSKARTVYDLIDY